MKLLMSISAVLFIICVQAQTINLDHFNKSIYTCNFNSAEDAKIWPSANTPSDLILLQNNSYLVHRKDALKGKYIFPDYQNLHPNYELQTSLKFENDAPAGLCFGFNEAHTQGYILEINTKKEFRIKKIKADGTFNFLTGPKEHNSWKKFGILAKTGISNDINILVIDGLVEIYLNNFYAYTFEDNIDYNARNFGLFVSPNAKIISTKFNLLINKNDETTYENQENIRTETELSNTDPNASAAKYLEKLVALNNKLNLTQKELEEHIVMLEKCKEDNEALNTYISNNLNTELQGQIDELKDQNTKQEKQIEKLKTENTALLEFKDFYMNSSKDTDIINFLYDELHRLEEENARLKKQVNTY